MKKFYITSPLYYVNDKPHIGHAYTTILCDVIARYHRMFGEEAHFLTGTDEHGQKVQGAAEKRGIEPRQHCNEMVVHFQHLWKKLHIENDDFIRTTEQRHTVVVQHLLQKLWDSGDIYKDEYEGLYSVSEERFITEKEYEEGDFREVKKVKEVNYFFKMSKYQQRLIDHVEKNPGFIKPQSRQNEVLGFLRQKLNDLCISRPKSRLSWGITLPFDSDFVTYVWFDALTNYISAVGYPVDEEKFESLWPADYQVIGKDILTTHAVYWTTMLLAAEIPLPKTILAHGWWLTGETKMSKSLGNVVNPLDLIDEFGVDAVRYYLIREMVLGQDASFTVESFVARYNADLANDLGNLTNRIFTLTLKNFDKKTPVSENLTAEDREVQNFAETMLNDVPNLIDELKLNQAIEAVMKFVRFLNGYLERRAPWKLLKNEDTKAEAGTVLFQAMEGLRLIAALLHPIMPEKMKKLQNGFGFATMDVSARKWGQLIPERKISDIKILFPRIEIKEKTEEKSEENLVEFEDFKKMKFKTGVVETAEKVEKADRLLKLTVKIGDETRQLVAGIAEHYAPEDVVGKTVIVLTNLKPAKIRGIESQGMVLAASDESGLTLLTTDGDLPSGSEIQ